LGQSGTIELKKKKKRSYGGSSTGTKGKRHLYKRKRQESVTTSKKEKTEKKRNSEERGTITLAEHEEGHLSKYKRENTKVERPTKLIGRGITRQRVAVQKKGNTRGRNGKWKDEEESIPNEIPVRKKLL